MIRIWLIEHSDFKGRRQDPKTRDETIGTKPCTQGSPHPMHQHWNLGKPFPYSNYSQLLLLTPARLCGPTPGLAWRCHQGGPAKHPCDTSKGWGLDLSRIWAQGWKESCSLHPLERSIPHPSKGMLIPGFVPEPEQFQEEGKPNGTVVTARTFLEISSVQKVWRTARSSFKVI